MSIPNPVDKFLQAVFGSDYGTQAIFANLHPAVHVRDFQQLDPKRDCYWSIAAFPPDHTGTNREEDALEVRALVIDDVGTKVMAGAVEVSLGQPTAVVETSLHNCQWVYRLSKPVAKDDWAGFFGGIEAMIGQKLEAPAAQTLMRLPMGVNTKPLKARFAVRLVELNPGVEIDPDTIPRVHRAKSPASQEAAPWVHHIKEMLAALPNDVLYDEWIDIGQRALALAVDTEDAHEAWIEFSSRTTLKVYDHDFSEARWASFTADRTKGGLLVDAVQKLGSAAAHAWWQLEAPYVFDDGVIHPEAPKAPKGKGITATPFKWMDLSKTNPRDWLYGDILLRKFISMTVAPGGTGKSSLVAVETLAQVTGRDLLEEELPSGALRVWLWNLEDPYEETQKKILAAAKHYGIAESEIGDRLFVDSGRDQRLVVAEMRGSTPMIVRPVIAALVEQIKLRQIDVVVIDPFISCHGVPENDNGAMDMVVKEWGRVAEEGNCAVHLVDHTSKAGSKEVVTDSSRGAKSKTDAARIVRVVNRMTETDGKAYGVIDTWRYFNTFNDKANMAPPKARRDWFRMEGIWAGNGANAAQVFSVGAASANTLGDSIGVAVPWKVPSAKAMATGDNYTATIKVMEGKRWRSDVRASDWVGKAVAQGCGLLPQSTADLVTIKALIKTWISEGLWKEVRQLDEKRNIRDYIEIAQVY